MSARVVLDLNLKFQFALHVKRDKIKIALLIVSLKKSDFLQMKPNMGNIYKYIYIYQIKVFEETSLYIPISRWRPRRGKWPTKATNPPHRFL